MREGILYYETNKLYVPCMPSLKRKLLFEYHDNGCHIGQDKTIELVSRTFYWPNMSRDIRKYISSCYTCQSHKTNINSIKKQGLLNPLAIPDTRWSTISIDFIVQLPTSNSKHKYDAILNVVDKCSKQAHFIPTHTNVTAPEVAELIFNNIVRLHGIPSVIISDRDSKFTSKFWKQLWKIFNTKFGMSTAFHPESDGATERMNRTLEDMLRSIINDKQDNWDTLLPMCELVYNNSANASTGYTPFYLNYGQEINLPINLLANVKNNDDINNASVLDTLTKLSDNLQIAENNLRYAQIRQKKYADENRKEIEFKVGDIVWLSAEHINFATTDVHGEQFTKKLLPKSIGPFPILERIGAVAYKLDLPPKYSRLHPVFHVSKLIQCVPNDDASFPNRVQDNRPPPALVESKDNETSEYFEVEYILDKKTKRNKIYYLVKWVGYPSYENTWEPVTNLKKYAKESIETYELSIIQ
jgi:hypothetical protein